ncbi:hypothetical protein JTE90_028721, partial [Oedothorax gibbosus]
SPTVITSSDCHRGGTEINNQLLGPAVYAGRQRKGWKPVMAESMKQEIE